MQPQIDQPPPPDRSPMPGHRLISIILVESFLVMLAGLTVWGIAWELNYFRVGLVLAIVIWLTVSPAIEIATVMSYRREQAGESEPTIASDNEKRA
jgi:hypothetical protein